VKDAAEYLKYIAESQGINADEDALHIIAQKADGAMRDALSIFDRVVSFSGKELTRKAVTENLNVLDYDTYFKATDFILAHDIPQALLLFNETLALGFDGHHFINGLASHFRDLMVCQHQETISLLEVGEAAQKSYRDQAQRTSTSFLLSALDLANACDLNYKTSKNQRLLVELTLMKLASIDFDGEKKNPESVALQNKTIDFIAPSAFYQNLSPVPKESIPVKNPIIEIVQEEPKAHTVAPRIQAKESPLIEKHLVQPEAATLNSEKAVHEEQTTSVKNSENEVATITDFAVITPQNTVEEPAAPKININAPTKRVSGLSISSLKAKKQHELNKIEVVIDEDALPRDSFTVETLRQHWNEFVNQIDAKGQKILASNLNTDVPKIKDEVIICIEMPNGTMKKEIERENYELMEFLRLKLNNHFIQLQITVNEKSAKKFAFTPEEKYQKLREKNPAIDLLRKEFDLDL
jgi:DNA polymerase-3 subunit gamma/tau